VVTAFLQMLDVVIGDVEMPVLRALLWTSTAPRSEFVRAGRPPASLTASGPGG